MNEQYKTAMMYRSNNIRDYIYSKRAIVLSRLDLYFKYPVITYRAEQNADATGFYNPAIDLSTDGIFDMRWNNQIVDKNILLHMFGLDPKERYYISIANVFIDINSDNIQYWTESIKSVCDVMNDEFEEFFLFVEENLADYLLNHPEDNIYEGGSSL